MHQDPMFVYKEPDFMAYSVENGNEKPYVTGDRLATFMLYLSEVRILMQYNRHVESNSRHFTPWAQGDEK